MEELIHALQNTILNTNYYQTNKVVSFVKVSINFIDTIITNYEFITDF